VTSVGLSLLKSITISEYGGDIKSVIWLHNNSALNKYSRAGQSVGKN